MVSELDEVPRLLSGLLYHAVIFLTEPSLERQASILSIPLQLCKSNIAARWAKYILA